MAKRGRPRKHQDPAARVAAWRKERREMHRLDGYITSKASWRLKALANAWGCSQAKAVERLLLEQGECYGDILFPETDTTAK